MKKREKKLTSNFRSPNSKAKILYWCVGNSTMLCNDYDDGIGIGSGVDNE